MKVLVTGATGFVGRYVLDRLLAEGHEVIALCSRARALPQHSAVQWEQADLLDPSHVTLLMQKVRPQGLIHLAWYAKHGLFWQAAENFDWCTATAHVLHAFHAAGGEKIVIAGTCAEYDLTQGVMSEDSTPTHASSVYGKCKDVTRQYVQQYGQQAGLNWVWGRVFFPYGPGEPATKLIPSVLHALAQSRTVACSHGQQLRDYLHVSDVAGALVHLLMHPQANGVFNIGSGQATRLMDIVNMCTQAFASPSPVQFGAIAVSPDEPPLIVADTHKLQATGWRPEVSLQDGLAAYAESVRRSEAC
jgi:nucleoside-diphosphate-sugar epimerase